MYAIRSYYVLGNIVFTMGVFIIFLLYSFCIGFDAMNSLNGLLYAINLFFMTIVALSFSFFVGNFASKKSIQPICNTFSLLFCFLGGSFVPQNILSETVKKTSIINPVFWYVKANNQIV